MPIPISFLKSICENDSINDDIAEAIIKHTEYSISSIVEVNT